MIDLQTYLQKKLRDIISNWNEEGIYAISFLVYANQAYTYNEYNNITVFSVSYNTENDCNNASKLSEERWNYAFWRQNETPVFNGNSKDEGTKILFNWYKENGIENIGYEDSSACYDNKMKYIGKGPIGYYEVLQEIAAVAKNLQNSGFIRKKFGAPIPIIIHDLEYSWYVIEANKIANPNGEANVFLTAMKELGFIN